MRKPTMNEIKAMLTKRVSLSGPQPNIMNMSDYPHIKESDLFRVLRHLPNLSVNGPWVAGGSVWRTISNEPLEKCDIDIFFQSQKQYDETVLKMNGLPVVNNIIKQRKNKWNTIYRFHVHEKKTFNKTFDVQLINMNFHRDIDSLLKSFDLTVCQFGYDGENLHCGLTSLDDLSAKRIILWSVTRPQATLKHLAKYLNNGFTISSEQTRELTYRLLALNCWKKSEAPDYNDDDNKKQVMEKTSTSVYCSSPQDTWNPAHPGVSPVRNMPPVVAQEVEHEYAVDPQNGRVVRRFADHAGYDAARGRNRRDVANTGDPIPTMNVNTVHNFWSNPVNMDWGYVAPGIGSPVDDQPGGPINPPVVNPFQGNEAMNQVADERILNDIAYRYEHEGYEVLREQVVAARNPLDG